MEIRRCRDGELHNARRRFQFPIIVGARIALDENATGGDGGAYFCVARDLNRIRDADVAHTGNFLADTNGISRLSDGRIRDSLVQTLLWVVKAESRGADIATHVYFSVGAAGNVHVAGGIRDFKANRTGHVIVAIESAANRRPRIAAD